MRVLGRTWVYHGTLKTFPKQVLRWLWEMGDECDFRRVESQYFKCKFILLPPEPKSVGPPHWPGRRELDQVRVCRVCDSRRWCANTRHETRIQDLPLQVMRPYNAPRNQLFREGRIWVNKWSLDTNRLKSQGSRRRVKSYLVSFGRRLVFDHKTSPSQRASLFLIGNHFSKIWRESLNGFFF